MSINDHTWIFLFHPCPRVTLYHTTFSVMIAGYACSYSVSSGASLISDKVIITMYSTVQCNRTGAPNPVVHSSSPSATLLVYYILSTRLVIAGVHISTQWGPQGISHPIISVCSISTQVVHRGICTPRGLSDQYVIFGCCPYHCRCTNLNPVGAAGVLLPHPNSTVWSEPLVQVPAGEEADCHSGGRLRRWCH